MGKQKKCRRQPHKENPTGLPSIKDFEEEIEEIEEDNDCALARVHTQLQSPNLEERLSALRTLESMCCEPVQAVQIAKSGITKIIAPFLVDSNTPVRAACASALRRIGESGGEEAYESLLKDDLMTPLIALLKKYYTEWHPKPQESGHKGRVDDEKETLIEAVTLLWSLCENSECAIKPSNEEKLISLLIKFLDASTYGNAISVVAAQCMLTLSEDNPLAIIELKTHESTLLSLLEVKPKSEREISEVIPLRILAAGLLTNVNSKFTLDDEATAKICKITNVIGETLAIDHKNIIVELASMLPSEKGNLTRTTKAKLLAVKKILGAQQEALEILANLCSEDQDNVSDSELDDSEPSEHEETIEDDAMDEKSCKILFDCPVALIEVITSTGLIKNVWEKTEAPEKSVDDELAGHSDTKCISTQIHTLRCRAFICLNNLMASFDVDTLGGAEELYRMWVKIGIIVFRDCAPNDTELLESSTAAMRAALQKLAEVRSSMFEQITESDIQPMLNGERQCANANIRANLIRILGNLALILVNSVRNSQLVKHIATSLLEICTKEMEVWVLAEALDSIMDIFAEDETDIMAAEIKLVEKLQSLVPVLISKIRQQRKKLGDNASVVATVKANLTRFIKYKGRQIANLK